MTDSDHSSQRRMVNLGCGARWHPAWINLDLNPRGPEVAHCDLGQPLPFAESTCDVIYSSAVLEHLGREQALALLRECHRCLKPGGVIRVGVPDLEAICRLYLEKLAQARAGDAAAASDYDWMVLELLDQMVRDTSGGEMLSYLKRDPITNEDFVRARIGQEGDEIIEEARAERAQDGAPADGFTTGRGSLLARGRRRIEAMQQALLRAWVGAAGVRALAVGRFRLSGEVHRWMYDTFSLSRLLGVAGFVEIAQQTASGSRIPDWPQYHLDTGADGSALKPDLFFMEATKAAAAAGDSLPPEASPAPRAPGAHARSIGREVTGAR